MVTKAKLQKIQLNRRKKAPRTRDSGEIANWICRKEKTTQNGRIKERKEERNEETVLDF